MRKLLCGLLLGACAAPPAHAQDRPVDLSGGYLSVNQSMHGWYGQATLDLGAHWSLVGQVDQSRGREKGDDTTTFLDHAFLGGVRYRSRSNRRVSPFVQTLVGGLHSRGTIDYVNVAGRRVQNEFTVGYFIFQPGVV